MDAAERVARGTPHVDHEMAQAIAIHRELKHTGDPDHIRRALRVAFAAHFRALLEFFHGSRPTGTELRDTDARYGDFLGMATDPFGTWPDAEKSRVDDADKLLAHISVLRDTKGDRPEWGGDEDMAMLQPKINHLFANVGQAGSRFPMTARLLGGSTPNSPRTAILTGVAVLALLLAILVVPWSLRRTLPSGYVATIGTTWAPIFSSPGPVYSINAGLWFAQIAVCALVLGVVLLWKRRPVR